MFDKSHVVTSAMKPPGLQKEERPSCVDKSMQQFFPKKCTEDLKMELMGFSRRVDEGCVRSSSKMMINLLD